MRFWKEHTVSKLIFEQESYAIRGAAFEVYKEMGHGFLEAVYQECMEKELIRQGVPFTSQQGITLSYKGEKLEQTYVPDLICFGQIIVELKAVSELAPPHEAQLLNYLRATGMKLGFLINFGSHPSVQIERRAL
jgi:GxxExxY protein